MGHKMVNVYIHITGLQTYHTTVEYVCFKYPSFNIVIIDILAKYLFYYHSKRPDILGKFLEHQI